MGKLIGLLAGYAAGWILDEGFFVTAVLTLLGVAVGLSFDRRRLPLPQFPPVPAAGGDLASRLARVEARLEAIEAAIAGLRGGAAPALPVEAPAIEALPAAADAAPAPEVEPAIEDASAPPPRPAYGARPAWTPTTVQVDAARGEAPAAPPTAAQTAPRRGPWSWFTEGNTLTRVGVVILFFGVAFLLSWFADHLTLSIEASLALVALAGAALVALGAKLAPGRPGYGLSLEGAGAGILYLTTFAASRLFDVLPPLPALIALVAVAALTVALAWRADSQPLAALAVAGGFLAPFLVAREPGAPAALFAWFAVLNAAVFALAWHRAWRALNALGAVFTFALGIFWGWRWYVPAHFAVAQPFLALYFAFYLGVAILYASRAPLEQRKPVDALFVFGVRVAAFALEAGLVRDLRYGAAYAAAGFAAIYAALFAARARGPSPDSRCSPARSSRSPSCSPRSRSRSRSIRAGPRHGGRSRPQRSTGSAARRTRRSRGGSRSRCRRPPRSRSCWAGCRAARCRRSRTPRSSARR